MWKKDFWIIAGDRAIRTIAQTALVNIGTAAVLSEVNWVYVVSASLLASVVSILTSIALGIPEVDNGTDQGNHSEQE